MRPIPPLKAAQYKVQFDCTRAPPPLQELFQDLFDGPQGMASSVSPRKTGVKTRRCGSLEKLKLAQKVRVHDPHPLTEELDEPRRRRSFSTIKKHLPHFRPPSSQVQAAQTANILSIQYLGGSNAGVTILVSKSAGRIAVQSQEFGALYLVCIELCERLQHRHCNVSFQDSLPLHDFFSVVDDHFSVRRHLDALRQDLADRTQQ